MFKNFIFFFLLFFFSCNQKNTSIKSPNFIIIFLDDLGYGDINSFGAINYETPNLNNLVNEGMLFTNFYTVQPVCSASRASLLTGCYSNRIGISGALMPYSKIGLNEKEITIFFL